MGQVSAAILGFLRDAANIFEKAVKQASTAGA